MTAHPTPETYAALKRLPADFLASPGLAIVRIAGSPAVKIPYSDGEGAAIGARRLKARIVSSGGRERACSPTGCGGWIAASAA